MCGEAGREGKERRNDERRDTSGSDLCLLATSNSKCIVVFTAVEIDKQQCLNYSILEKHLGLFTDILFFRLRRRSK